VPIPAINDIADGKAFSEGGSPPEYTFKTLWKKALTGAQKWHQDAYLVMANSEYINNDGIPSCWYLVFLSPSDELRRLDMEIDPWGKVIYQKISECGGDEEKLRRYRVAYGNTPVPANIIDSDVVVQTAIPAASAQFKMEKTKDPRAILSWDDELNKFIWDYMFFYISTAEYCSVNIDAQTGEVIEVWRGSSSTGS